MHAYRQPSSQTALPERWVPVAQGLLLRRDFIHPGPQLVQDLHECLYWLRHMAGLCVGVTLDCIVERIDKAHKLLQCARLEEPAALPL